MCSILFVQIFCTFSISSSHVKFSGNDPTVRQCYLNEIELLKSLQGSPYVVKMLE